MQVDLRHQSAASAFLRALARHGRDEGKRVVAVHFVETEYPLSNEVPLCRIDDSGIAEGTSEVCFINNWRWGGSEGQIAPEKYSCTLCLLFLFLRYRYPSA